MADISDQIAALESEKVFNEDELVERAMDDRDLAKEIVALFIEDGPSYVTKVKEVIKAGDLPNTKLQAHALKGAAGNLGASKLSKLAAFIESAAKEGDSGSVSAFSKQLDQEFDTLISMLNNFMAS